MSNKTDKLNEVIAFIKRNQDKDLTWIAENNGIVSRSTFFNWKNQGKIKSWDKVDKTKRDSKMVGYIYCITDKTNGKKYIGQHHYDKEELDKRYICGGTLMLMEYKKRPSDFTKEYLKTCYSETDLDNWEKYFIFSMGTLYPNGYNLNKGGNGVKPETRKKQSDFSKRLCEKIRQIGGLSEYKKLSWKEQHIIKYCIE